MPTASTATIERAAVAGLVGELTALRDAQRRAGNDLAALLTTDAIRTIEALNDLADTQGHIIDSLVAAPPLWRGSLRRHGRKARR